MTLQCLPSSIHDELSRYKAVWTGSVWRRWKWACTCGSGSAAPNSCCVTSSPPAGWGCRSASPPTAASVRRWPRRTHTSPHRSAGMFLVKALPAPTRAGADIPQRLFSVRSFRPTASAAAAASATQTEPRDRVQPAGEPGRDAARKLSINFEQTQEAFKSKDSLELLRSLLVFKLCSYDFLVDKNTQVMVMTNFIHHSLSFKYLSQYIPRADLLLVYYLDGGYDINWPWYDGDHNITSGRCLGAHTHLF